MSDDFKHLDETVLRAAIERLRENDKLFAGRKFFERLLNERGVEGVMNFITRASEALDKQDDLNLKLNFTSDERRIFNRTYLNLTSRREFLSTIGWAAPGAVFAAYGTASGAHEVQRAVNGDAGLEEREFFAASKEAVERYAYPPAEILVGAALVHEGFEEWLDIKLEQISDAMVVLADDIKKGEVSRSATR